MVYVDTTRLNILLKEYVQHEDSTAYTDLESEGIKQGEGWVQRYLKKHLSSYTIPTSPSTPPDMVVDAATFRSAAAILIVLSSNHEQINSAVKSWQDEAKECLDDFIATQLAEDDEPEPDTPIFTTYSNPDSNYN
jgi:hypothetical protein